MPACRKAPQPTDDAARVSSRSIPPRRRLSVCLRLAVAFLSFGTHGQNDRTSFFCCVPLAAPPSVLPARVPPQIALLTGMHSAPLYGLATCPPARSASRLFGLLRSKAARLGLRFAFPLPPVLPRMAPPKGHKKNARTRSRVQALSPLAQRKGFEPLLPLWG